jgi:hypothetical protein
MGLGWIQKLANLARDQHAGSLTDLDLEDFPRYHSAIARSMLHHLRLIYFTPSQTRDAGFAGPGVHHGDAGRRLLAGQDRAQALPRRGCPTGLPARWPTRPTGQVLGGLLSRRLRPARCLGDDRYYRPPPQRVLKVRWDCLGRYGGLAMLWHDQTTVGNYDTAIRILESL